MENTMKKLYFWNCTTKSLYNMIFFFFQKYNWKYKLSAVLGTVIKCPKGTGSTWEKTHRKVVFSYKQYICSAEDAFESHCIALYPVNCTTLTQLSEYTNAYCTEYGFRWVPKKVSMVALVLISYTHIWNRFKGNWFLTHFFDSLLQTYLISDAFGGNQKSNFAGAG